MTLQSYSWTCIWRKNMIPKDPWTPIYTVALFNNSQDMGATQMTTDRGMDEKDAVHI